MIARIERNMAAKPHAEQRFRFCLGILRLARADARGRHEAVCQCGLYIGANLYGSVRSILHNGLDRAFRPEPAPDEPPVRNANIRVGKYYH
jgi:transposase